MADSWTDELRAEVVAAYEKAEPNATNTMDIVKDLAESYGKTPNGVRMILTKAGVYVTKAAPEGGAGKSGTTPSEGGKRVSKADAIETLEKAIVAAGKEVDTEITSRLTGKAAVYFAELLSGKA
jgi:hypothetical protein